MSTQYRLVQRRLLSRPRFVRAVAPRIVIIIIINITYRKVVLGALVVIVLVIGFKVRSFRPSRMDLRAMKIHSTTSFLRAVKLSAHVLRFYGMLKNPAEYEKDIL
jgi:hypothetical protein